MAAARCYVATGRDCLRKDQAGEEPMAKVTMEPMRTYQVKATWGMVKPAEMRM